MTGVNSSVEGKQARMVSRNMATGPFVECITSEHIVS